MILKLSEEAKKGRRTGKMRVRNPGQIEVTITVPLLEAEDWSAEPNIRIHVVDVIRQLKLLFRRKKENNTR